MSFTQCDSVELLVPEQDISPDHYARAEIAKVGMMAATNDARLAALEDTVQLQFRGINDRLMSIDKHLEEASRTNTRVLFTFLVLVLSAFGTVIFEIAKSHGLV